MIRVAILGAGFMGATHAAAWKALGGRVEVVTIASRTLARAQKLAADVGSEATDDVDAAARSDVDLVDVCLPTALHRRYAEVAFAAGRHVLVEKPIALTAEDGEAIVAAAAASGRYLLVGLVLRFWPEYEELHAVVGSGELGRPLAASAVRLSPPVGWNDWMIDGVQSGGAAVDLMVHDFDQLNALLGPARSVAARAVTAGPFDAPQHVAAVVAHDGGAGVAEGGLMLPDSYPFTSNLRVLCERGVAEYGFAAGPAVGGGNIGGVDQDANRLRIHPRDEPARYAEVVSGDPWHRQAAYLADCIERGTRPDRATGEQALAALRVSLAANRSLASEHEEAVD